MCDFLAFGAVLDIEDANGEKASSGSYCSHCSLAPRGVFRSPKHQLLAIQAVSNPIFTSDISHSLRCIFHRGFWPLPLKASGRVGPSRVRPLANCDQTRMIEDSVYECIYELSLTREHSSRYIYYLFPRHLWPDWVARVSSSTWTLSTADSYKIKIEKKSTCIKSNRVLDLDSAIGGMNPGNQLSTPTRDSFRTHHLCNTGISNLVAVDSLML